MIAAPVRGPASGVSRPREARPSAVYSRVWQMAFIGLIALAFALRLSRLDAQSLWIDEAFSVSRAQLGPWLAGVGDELYPPLYYSGLAVWVIFTGTSEFAVRFFSVMPGVIAVALAARAAREHSLAAAIFAGALLTLSPLAIYFAQETRAYALAGLFGIGSVYGAWKIWTRREFKRAGPSGTVLFVVCSLLLVYAHFAGILLLLLLNAIAVVWFRREGEGISRWWAAQRRLAIYSVFCLPFLARLVLTGPGRPHAIAPSPAELLRTPALAVLGPNPPEPLIVAFWASALALIAVCSLWLLRRGSRDPGTATDVLWPAVWLGLPAAFVVAAWLAGQFGLDVFQVRYLVILVPVACVGVGALLGELPLVPLSAFGAFSLLASAVIGFQGLAGWPAEQRDDWRGLLNQMHLEYQDGDLAVIDQGWSAHPFDYYNHGQFPRLGIPIEVNPAELSFPPEPYAGPPWQLALARGMQPAKRIWLVRFLPRAFATAEEAKLWFGDRGFTWLEDRNHGNIGVQLYARPLARSS